MIKAIIFDFDGTIADTVPVLREGINLTMRYRGYPERTYDDILHSINHGARELVRRSMPAHLQNDEKLVDSVFADYNRFYGEVYHHTDKAYDGIPELVARLHKTYKIGVLSNKQNLFTKKLSEQVLLPGTCDGAQGVIDGKPVKPDPFMARTLANHLGVKTEECVMIGDSDVDIATARNANMFHIAALWGYRDEKFLRAHGAETFARTPDEIEKILDVCSRKPF